MSDQTPAKVVEETGLVIASMQPGADIVANFDELDSWLEGKIEDYKDARVDLAYLPMARKDRAYLNGLLKDLDERRKSVKKAYMRPYEVFEMRLKQSLALITEVTKPIDEQIKALEEEERTQKRAELQKHWRQYVISDAVSFETVEDPKWMNRSVSIEAARKALDAQCEKVVADIETLDGLEMEFDVDAKAAYYETLDIGKAIARNKELVARKAAAEEIERQRAEYEAAQAKVAEEAQAELVAVEPPAPEPVPAPVEQPAEPVSNVVPLRGPGPAPDPVRDPWCFHVSCTTEERAQIIAFIGGLGLSGRATREEA